MKTKVKKRENVEDDDTNFKIMFSLINAEKPLTLTEISNDVELQPNLVFYHLKNLKKKYIVLETEDKEYYCQPFITDDYVMEDIDSLLIMIIKTITREIERDDDITEKKLGEAVLENLKMYMKIFELIVQ